MLEIKSFVVGPIQTNTYLVGDTARREAVIVDPGWDGKLLLDEAKRQEWKITGIWLTHAHFDHIGAVPELSELLKPFPDLALHPDDIPLWQVQGGAAMFGMQLGALPTPNLLLKHGQKLQVGAYEFEVRHTPGHSPGHVIFSGVTEAIVFCGDLIFSSSIGRTDLPGGNYQQLMESIHSEILPLADDTRLLTGHGPQTSVVQERMENPFLS